VMDPVKRKKMSKKNKIIVYLAGFINSSNMKECSAWRQSLRETYQYRMTGYDIEWSDPTKDNVCHLTYPNAIVHHDYSLLSQSNLIIANLDTFGYERPLTGTIAELAWAYQQRKPIITIISEDKAKEFYSNHPFIRVFSSFIVESVDDIIKDDLIGYFIRK